jgi:hypothetical protein
VLAAKEPPLDPRIPDEDVQTTFSPKSKNALAPSTTVYPDSTLSTLASWQW